MRPLTLVLALTALQLIPSAPSPGEQLFARFGEYVDALRTQAGIPGLTAAVVGENDLLWERGFGQQDLGRSLAAQPDTPYFLDGLTQLFTATLVLQCAEEGRLSLSDPIAKYDADSPWAGATLAQALSHAHGSPSAQTFSYQLERLDPLKSAIRVCRGDSYRETMANLLSQLAMMSSVPGTDVVALVPPAEGVPDAAAAARYNDILARLATAYSVSSPGQRPMIAFVPERIPCGCRRLDASAPRKSGAGTRAQTAASGPAGSIESASIRRSEPEGRKNAVPATVTLCPNRSASCSAANPSAMPFTAFPSSTRSVNIRSLWRIVSSVPATRVRCGSGVVRIKRSTAATDSESTITRCVPFLPFVSSIDENPADKTRSNRRKTDSRG